MSDFIPGMHEGARRPSSCRGERFWSAKNEKPEMSYQITYSDADEIVEPDFHDANVNGLLVTKDKSLLVSVSGSSCGNKCLVLHGLERLRCDDFRQGNIILDITVSSGPSINVDDLAYVHDVQSDMPFLQSTMDRLRSQNRLLVRLNPSYGCSLVGICQRITVEDDLFFAKIGGRLMNDSWLLQSAQ